ncbi:MAG: sigma-54-dependent Fis family transcriptional regulator [Deltaproteobacteria bacterium]|nr:sigma-54-dependent Fis family transcriptional regulator [Deltaproteobacteria bacterium]
MSENLGTILVIDDEDAMRHMLKMLLTREGYQVDLAGHGQEGLARLKNRTFDYVLCDIQMPVMGGLSFLEQALADGFSGPIIMMSAYGTVDTAIQSMKLGAYDYVSKPFKADEIILTLKKAEEREQLRRENLILREEAKKTYNFSNIISKSPAMKKIFQTISRVAEYKTSVLITGPSGSGKELVARAIHHNGPRRDKPFMAVDCGAIPENLLESELFGFVKGAFTDAYRDKKGLLAEAAGGTFFLDEIGELPVSLQVKLLRVLQEEEIRPVGDTRSYKIDVRIIAATSRDLSKEVAARRFRQDLYYRINVMSVVLPPLAERKEDIPLLTQHFIEKLNHRLNHQVNRAVPEVMALFMSYHWPGNVRELENVIERAMVLTEGSVITLDSLPLEIMERKSATPGSGSEPSSFGPLADGDLSIKKGTRHLEKILIIQALTKTGGNRTHAAKLLEISHMSLLSKIKKYAVDL